MQYTLTFAASALVMFSGFLAYFLARQLNLMRNVGFDPGLPMSPDRYRPMLRLLSEDDFRFLASGGWNASMVRKARAERRRLFRGYLRTLTKDYSRLLAGLRAHMAESTVDRPDLAKALSRNQWLFTMAVARIEWNLALNAIGGGSVQIDGLVGMVEGLRTQVSSLVSLPAPEMMAVGAR